MGAFHCGTVALAGRPNTGKSSLLNKMVGHKLAIVSPKAQTTRHSVNGVLTTPDCQYIFVWFRQCGDEVIRCFSAGELQKGHVVN